MPIKEYTCQNPECDNVFSDRVRKGRKERKYCSHECAHRAKSLRGSVELICENCGSAFRRKKSALKRSRHRKYFCSRECKEYAQSLQGKCDEIRPSHYGTGNGEYFYKTLIRKTADAYCVGCGEKREYLLCVHHVDGNESNNSVDNLEIVCFNCHGIRHLEYNKEEDVWIYKTAALTPREKIHIV